MAKHQYKKGHEKIGGRKKGTKNLITKSFKELVQKTYEELEETGEGMLEWSMRNKTEFYKIASKLIPTAIEAKIKGELKFRNIIFEDGIEQPKSKKK